MAGTNRVIKEGQVLFRAGDKSDGMYLIRRGEIRVYLEQDGKEVTLATIGEGGMIGEMALFDNQPRSASVKAGKETEITLISTEDFGKLIKQIPKWFVGLMQALSSRLRQANERLKKLEGMNTTPGKGKPFQNAARTLNILMLLWHKDGEKEGKDWVLRKLETEKLMIELFNEDKDKLKTLLEVLVKEKLLTTRPDSYKNVVLAMSNRGSLNALASAIGAFLKTNPAKPCLSDGAIAMVRVLERLTMAAPYDTSTVTVGDLEKEGKRDGYNTTTWATEIKAFQPLEEVKMVKTSSGVGLRTTKKDVQIFLKHHEIIAAMYKANLA